MARPAAQADLQCPACAGQRVYSPPHGGLRCLQCGEIDVLAEDPGDAAAERDYPEPDDPPAPTETVAHRCEACGGEVIFSGPALSERCAYCNGPVVRRPADDAFETTALIPFRVEAELAYAFALEWVGKRLAAPGDLAEVVARADVAGLYAPFWTFDTHEAIAYVAKIKRGRGKSSYTETIGGQMTTTFDDLLAPGSHHITPLIRDGILHDFEPHRLRPFLPAYLSGFAAERHHQTVEEGLASLSADKSLLIRNRIKTHINDHRVTNIVFKTDTSGIRYRRILLPVWMLHYEYKGHPMKVVVCGMKGRAFGERPFSRRKLAIYAAALGAVAIVTGILWGVAAAP